MVVPSTKTEILKSLNAELLKIHIEQDGTGRDWKIYAAKDDATHGSSCIVTEYKYEAADSTKITDFKEYYGEWDSSWDF